MSPALDQDLGLEQRIEELAIQKLGAEFPVERFDIAILPRASGLDEQGAHADLTEPLSDRGRREFRSVVRTDMCRRPTLYEQIRKALQACWDCSRLATTIARHSRENSSITTSMRSFRPSWVASSMKS